jgi:Malonyl-CoA decarboxylase C-terminal domain
MRTPLCSPPRSRRRRRGCRLAATYVCRERSRGKLVCPVGNFHVSNGAGVERICYMADTSEKVRTGVACVERVGFSSVSCHFGR